MLPGWVALFFYTVNQVLVRLWARVIDIDPWLQDRGFGEDPVVRLNCLTGNCWLFVLNAPHSGEQAAPQRSAARVQRRVKILSDGSFDGLREQFGKMAI